MDRWQCRPVGWSGDGGVRETMRVELTSGGGAFPVVWGSAVSSPIGVWGSFATFTMLKSQNIIIIKVGGGRGAVHFRSDMKSGGGGGAVRFRSDAFLWHTENTLSFIINGYNFDRGGCSSNRSPQRHCTT